MKTRRTLLIVFLLIWSIGVYADDPPESEQIIADIAKREKTTPAEVKEALEQGCSSGNTALMRQCGYYHWVGADIQLNQTYRKLQHKLGKSSATAKLAAAERAWVTFRDATCDYETEGWGNGSGRSVVYQGCLQTLTEERNKKLQEYLECKNNECPSDLDAPDTN